MNKKKLLKNLDRLGYTLMEVEEDFDANNTLAEVVKSEDTRLWEGFPVLLANAAQEYRFNHDTVLENLSQQKDKENFRALLLLSLAVYQFFHLSFLWASQMQRNLSDEDVDYVKQLRNYLVHDTSFSVSNKYLDPYRFKTTFNRYFEKEAEKSKQLREKHEELSLEYALSQLFSPKQKELFKKKLNGEPLSKTEKEYYSRTVKKKISAVANPELHRLSQKLMEY